MQDEEKSKAEGPPEPEPIIKIDVSSVKEYGILMPPPHSSNSIGRTSINSSNALRYLIWFVLNFSVFIFRLQFITFYESLSRIAQCWKWRPSAENKSEGFERTKAIGGRWAGHGIAAEYARQDAHGLGETTYRFGEFFKFLQTEKKIQSKRRLKNVKF